MRDVPKLNVLGFVIRSTNCTNVAQGLFFGGPGRKAEPKRARRLQKCLGPRWHSPKEVRLRRQATNLTPPKRVKGWGSRMPVKARLDRLPPQPEHIRPATTLPHSWVIQKFIVPRMTISDKWIAFKAFKHSRHPNVQQRG